MVLTELQRSLAIAAALRRFGEFTSKKISQLPCEPDQALLRN